MRTFLQRTLIYTVAFLLFSSWKSNAQIWTVGIPVNTTVTSNFIDAGSGTILGCFPNASVNYNFALPTVSGIQFYLKVTSVDPNSCYLMPGNDTLQVGDSIAVFGGTTTKTLYYFATTASTSVQMDLRAVGTPTSAAQAYPCNITNLFWMSNLMLCPEGISVSVPTNCNVTSGPTSTISIANDDYKFISPQVENNFSASLFGCDLNTEITLHTYSGEILKSFRVTQNENVIPCEKLPNGLYFISSISKGVKHSEKISVVR